MTWDARDDWKQGPYHSMNHELAAKRERERQPLPLIDVEHIIDVFSLMTFSYAVSAIWDWDIQLDTVRMSRRTVLEAHKVLQELQPGAERYSLEQLVWEGWGVPAVWFRAGNSQPEHAFIGAVPIPAVLDDSLVEHGLAILFPAKQPEDRPAYIRMSHAFDSAEVHPDAWRLDAILAEKKQAFP